ncbi:MAG: SDR family NAD(P)-dependent oxidoreductase, partial [Deltaproteobacteria bacterium]
MSIFRDDVLKGRRALVTGGGSGICRGIAQGLAAHGCRVAVMGRKQEALDATVELLGGSGGLAVAGDVRQPDQVEAAVRRTVETFGGLDLLVNGAAGNFLCPAAQLSPNGFRTVVEIDLQGTFNMTRASFTHLQQAGGCIVNISATLH